MREDQLKNLCIIPSQYSCIAGSVVQEKFPGIKFQIVNTQELRQNLKRFFKNYFRFFDRAILFTYDLDVERKPLVWALILLWLSKKEAYFVDMQVRVEKISYLSLFFRYLPSFLLEIIFIPLLFLRMKQGLWHIFNKKNTLIRLKNNQNLGAINYKPIADSCKVAYLRTDHWFGLRSGGSVGHIKGVAGGFLKLGYLLFFISTDKLELIEESKTPIYVIKPNAFIKSFRELPELEYNHQLIKQGREILLKEKPAFVYQRYSLNNYAGTYLAKEFNLPFVLEYNGSFPWMSRHWGKPLRFEKIANKIELINLQAADLIVVVSKPMRNKLIQRGVPEKKILVNPNGVDPERFSPGIDGSHIRKKYALEGKTVVGFIGTFSKWHGAEVLAKAVKPVVETSGNIHFLFIGDGPMMPEVKRIIEEDKVNKYVTFTGIVAQGESPEYLATCDILVSPHVPNPDGTPFFGSPTKLFEYMAMGKGIVASNLEQIGEILKPQKTAWMITPGDVDELMEGIIRLVENKSLRKRLGERAREDVIANYTWEKNVEKVIDKLKML